MAQELIDRYRRWFDYEKDSHAKVLASLRTVPEDQRDNPAFRKAVSVAAHIAAGRQLWLFRFGVAREAPRDFFPQGLTLTELEARLESVHAAWSDYLQKLDDAELSRDFEYRSLDAGWFRSRIEDILTQLFGHSWYHRGQIASLVKAAGGQPAITDFVFWTREAIPGRE
jgi:uncharacterized damage-inducible protein DinB